MSFHALSCFGDKHNSCHGMASPALSIFSFMHIFQEALVVAFAFYVCSSCLAIFSQGHVGKRGTLRRSFMP
jgi:hypothetical protein